jgi:FtsP/CotA-like multicopper oxidase with cupredoxin domain
VIQQTASAPPIPHPIHLHGHDFYVIGAGTGVYSDPSTLNYNNPPRRDVATLPGGGYLVIAFVTDNPGAWLMHCHIVSFN